MRHDGLAADLLINEPEQKQTVGHLKIAEVVHRPVIKSIVICGYEL